MNEQCDECDEWGQFVLRMNSIVITSFSWGRVSHGNYDANQSLIVLNFTKELHTRPYMATKECMSGTKHFHWVISCFIFVKPTHQNISKEDLVKKSLIDIVLPGYIEM